MCQGQSNRVYIKSYAEILWYMISKLVEVQIIVVFLSFPGNKCETVKKLSDRPCRVSISSGPLDSAKWIYTFCIRNFQWYEDSGTSQSFFLQVTLKGDLGVVWFWFWFFALGGPDSHKLTESHVNSCFSLLCVHQDYKDLQVWFYMHGQWAVLMLPLWRQPSQAQWLCVSVCACVCTESNGNHGCTSTTTQKNFLES